MALSLTRSSHATSFCKVATKEPMGIRDARGDNRKNNKRKRQRNGSCLGFLRHVVSDGALFYAVGKSQRKTIETY